MSVTAWIKALLCSGTAPFKRAAAEIFVIGLVSAVPLVLASLGAYLDQGPDAADHQSFFEIFASASLNGQLLFYAISFIGSVLWYSGTELKKPFPLRLFFVIPSVLGLLIAGAYIARDPSLKSLSYADVGFVSVLIYAGAALLYFFIVMFHSIDPPDYDRSQREGERDLMSRVARRHNEQPGAGS